MMLTLVSRGNLLADLDNTGTPVNWTPVYSTSCLTGLMFMYLGTKTHLRYLWYTVADLEISEGVSDSTQLQPSKKSKTKKKRSRPAAERRNCDFNG